MELELFIESIKRRYELKSEHLKEIAILEMFDRIEKLNDQVNKLKKELKELKSKNEQ